jgi:hypothetical protein
MSKTEQKACLSTSSSSDPSSPPLPRHPTVIPNPSRPLPRRVVTAPSKVQTAPAGKSLDRVLVFCYVLVYLELAWLILLLLRSYSRD